MVNLANYAEMQGASGVVVNAPTANEVIREVHDTIDIPIIVTAFSAEGIAERIESGAAIINVAAGAITAVPLEITTESAERSYDGTPLTAAVYGQDQLKGTDLSTVAIIATGGPTDESLMNTISAGANAIVWTPPSPGDVFKEIMTAYRNGEAHP